MRMVMAMQLACPCTIMFIAMLVAMVPEMRSMTMRLFENIANARRCHVGGIQREHDGEKNNEARAHGGGV